MQSAMETSQSAKLIFSRIDAFLKKVTYWPIMEVLSIWTRCSAMSWKRRRTLTPLLLPLRCVCCLSLFFCRSTVKEAWVYELGNMLVDHVFGWCTPRSCAKLGRYRSVEGMAK